MTSAPEVRFTVARFILHQLATAALVAVPARPALPVIGSFRIDVSPGRLRLAATDGELTVFAETPAVDTDSTGTIYILARKLQAILAEAPEGQVTIAVSGGFASVSVVSSGKGAGATWSLKLPGTTNAPELLDPAELSFKAARREDFLSALKTVRHAVSADSGRPQYTQVHIAEHDGSMYATASDSNQLSRVPVKGFPLAMDIPLAVLDDLTKLLAGSPVEDAEVASSRDHLVFRAGTVTLAVLRLSTAFPDMDRLMLEPARANEAELGVSKTELQAALRRVRINADGKTSAIALIVERGDESGHAQLTVLATDADGNSATEEVGAAWEGGSRTLVVNSKFLEGMLAAHPAGDCAFRLGPDRGKTKTMVLLEDTGAGVSGVLLQLAHSLLRL
jgi:DNA polymerase III sliding clamp (beta) subunit (PCNA family)